MTPRHVEINRASAAWHDLLDAYELARRDAAAALARLDNLEKARMRAFDRYMALLDDAPSETEIVPAGRIYESFGNVPRAMFT